MDLSEVGEVEYNISVLKRSSQNESTRLRKELLKAESIEDVLDLLIPKNLVFSKYDPIGSVYKRLGELNARRESTGRFRDERFLVGLYEAYSGLVPFVDIDAQSYLERLLKDIGNTISLNRTIRFYSKIWFN